MSHTREEFIRKAEYDAALKSLMEARAEVVQLTAERDSWRNLYNREVEHNEAMFESEEATKQTIAEFKAAGADEVVVLMPHQEARGFLEIGTDGHGMVVVNLDQDRTGHIVFSPAQAKGLAETLARKATLALTEIP